MSERVREISSTEEFLSESNTVLRLLYFALYEEEDEILYRLILRKYFIHAVICRHDLLVNVFVEVLNSGADGTAVGHERLDESGVGYLHRCIGQGRHKLLTFVIQVKQ